MLSEVERVRGCRGRARAWPALCQARALASLGRASDVQQSVPRHTEDEARAVLGEVRLWLIEPGLHRDGAFLPMQAALHRVGDIHLKVALLTARLEQTGQAASEWADTVLWFPWQPQGPATCQAVSGFNPLSSQVSTEVGGDPGEGGGESGTELYAVGRTLCSYGPGRWMWLSHSPPGLAGLSHLGFGCPRRKSTRTLNHDNYL